MNLLSSVGIHVNTLVHVALFNPSNLVAWCAGDGPMHVSISIAALTCLIVANQTLRPACYIPWYETFLVGKG